MNHFAGVNGLLGGFQIKCAEIQVHFSEECVTLSAEQMM